MTSAKNKEQLKKYLRPSGAKVLVLVGLIAAFLIRFFLIPDNGVITPDGVYYATLGEKMASGDLYGGISAYWSPLYSFLIALVYFFVQDSEFAGRLVSVIAGALVVIPVYLLIFKFYGRAAAYIGTILVVIHPLLVRSSVWALTESIYTLMFALITLTGWYALRKVKSKFFFFTGLLLGAAYLLKPEAIGFVGLFFVLTAAVKLFRPHLTVKKLVVSYLFLILGFSFLLVPYVVFLRQKTGTWTISQKLQTNTMFFDRKKPGLEITEDGRTTRRDQVAGDDYTPAEATEASPPAADPVQLGSKTKDLSGIKEIADQFLRFLKMEIRKFIPNLFPFFYLFMMFVIIGFFYRPWTRLRLAKELYLFSLVASTLIGYAASIAEFRYLIPLIPIFICWIAVGVVGFSYWAAKSDFGVFRAGSKFVPKLVQIVALAALSVLLTASIPDQIARESAQGELFREKAAGLWIKDRSPNRVLIMDSSPIAAFYAGADHTYLPNEDLDVVLDYAKRKGVTYIVYSRRRSSRTPKFSPTDQSEPLPPNVKLVHEIGEDENKRIFIYKLLD